MSLRRLSRILGAMALLAAAGAIARASDPDFPSVTGVSPATGPVAGGTTITVTGENLSGALVHLGTATVTAFSAASPTSLTFVTPPGPLGTADITVTTPFGTSTLSSDDQFTYAAFPTVTGVSPRFGPTVGGNEVTITGYGLDGGTVTIGGTPVTDITAASATAITCFLPAGSGRQDIQVTTPVGSSQGGSSDYYTYTDGPGLTTVSPQYSRTAGGGLVTLTGVNLSGATVTVDGVPVVPLSNTATTITFHAPSDTAGTVAIVVTTATGTTDGLSGGAGALVYTDAPVVTGVSPATGATAGGASVTISGINFLGTDFVLFGDTDGGAFTVNPATSITLTSPAHTAGPVDIVVDNSNYGSSQVNASDVFIYADTPVVTGLSPAFSPLAGGGTVTITGTSLSGAAVSVGGVPVPVTSVSVTAVTFVAPANSAGALDVTVTTARGTSATGAADLLT